MKTFHSVMMALVLVGALNWGLVGLFQFDLVAAIFGHAGVLTRMVYLCVCVAGVDVAFTACNTLCMFGRHARPELPAH